MRNQFTPAQIRMLVYRADRQLEAIIDQSIASEPAGKNIARTAHAPLHETVVSLIRLFRDHVPDAASIATLIAREYARGVDAKSGAPTLASVRAILSIVRGARESYLPQMESGEA
jgi:hypothetical protein